MQLPKQKGVLMFKRAAILIGSLCFAFLLFSAQAPKVQDMKVGLEYVVPEDVGWSSQKLEEAKAFAEKINSAAVMVLYDGKVFISWGNVATKYRIHSIRKPLLSALYGIYWSRGKISLGATLDELNIDDIPPSLTKEEKTATVQVFTTKQRLNRRTWLRRVPSEGAILPAPFSITTTGILTL